MFSPSSPAPFYSPSVSIPHELQEMKFKFYSERVPKERDLFLLINIFIFNYIIVKMRSALKTDLLWGKK